MLVMFSYFFDCSHPQCHRVRHHIRCLSTDGGEPLSQSEVTSPRERTVRGPLSSAPTLNYWVGLAVATCSMITTLPAKAHRHTSQSQGKILKKNNITVSSKALVYFDVFIRRGQLYLGLEMYDESTETCHVDNFLTLPLKASGMNLPSGLKPLKLI